MIKKDFNALKTIIEQQLCCGCGTCAGICPKDAVYFPNNNYFPEWFNEEECTKCGSCVKVCPGNGLNIDEITRKSKTSGQKYLEDIGNYINFKIGHSKDKFIRNKSSSGGVATSLLMYALEKKIIDKAIVVVNDDKEVAKPVVKITNSKKVLIDSMQSKYIQVPLNTALKEILHNDKKYGVVGLPCHIEGLELAQNMYKSLSNRIIFKIGLFCGYSYSYDCMDALLNEIECKKDSVNKFLGWREGTNYPGFFAVQLKNGKKLCLSYFEEHNITVANYALFRCFLCIDGLSQLSDISLGDTTDTKSNSTFIITRTKIGKKLLSLAKASEYIDYYELKEDRALKEGIIPFMVTEKRQKVLAVINYISRRGIPVPQWDIQKSKINQIDKINSILRIKLVFLIRSPFIRRLLLSRPELMKIVGGYVYKIDIDLKKALYFKIIKVLEKSPGLTRIKALLRHNG